MLNGRKVREPNLTYEDTQYLARLVKANRENFVKFAESIFSDLTREQKKEFLSYMSDLYNKLYHYDPRKI
jgi:hypothetical protein